MLIAVSPPWGPDGYRLFVHVTSSVDLAVKLGEAIGRDYRRWGHSPTKYEVTQTIRTMECFPEPGENAEGFLQVPPRTWVHLVREDEGDEEGL